LAPCHGALQQEVNRGLRPYALIVYLGKEGEQGAPYSSLTIHVVLPLACMGLGNVECECRLVRHQEFKQPQITQLFFGIRFPLMRRALI
jgi:hypothetical protein